jgi:hypothetical protein
VFSFSSKIITTEKFNLGAGLLEAGDWNNSSLLVANTFGKYQFKGWSLAGEYRHIFLGESKLNEHLLARFENKLFTVEGMLAVNDSVEPYAWVAIHPEKFYAAIGFETTRTWAAIGTKGWNNFGNLTFGDYDWKTGNFWIRSQTGIGEINKGFFNQDLYNLALNYFVIPSFFYLHLSPLSTKGTRTFKVDIARTNGVYAIELAYGRQIGKIFQTAVGMTSKITDSQVKIAPMIEVYKDWQLTGFKAIMELRYEFLSKQLLGYITLRYDI